jgi:hypothetical protein
MLNGATGYVIDIVLKPRKVDVGGLALHGGSGDSLPLCTGRRIFFALACSHKCVLTVRAYVRPCWECMVYSAQEDSKVGQALVEVDGPFHFLAPKGKERSMTPRGPTSLKRLYLRALCEVCTGLPRLWQPAGPWRGVGSLD